MWKGLTIHQQLILENGNDLKIDSKLLYFYNCIILCSSIGPSLKCFPAKFGPVPVPGMFTPTVASNAKGYKKSCNFRQRSVGLSPEVYELRNAHLMSASTPVTHKNYPLGSIT